MKYIVKNCPCYDKEYEECLNTPRDTYENCIDISNCLIKQVIEKCNKAIKTYDNNEFYEDDIDLFMGEKNMAESILDLFEIEEVKE